MAASGPDSPIPPGVERLPEPGELIVSPAIEDLLASPDGDGLRAWLPGEIVGTIGKAGLVDADDLVVYTGFTAGQANPAEAGEQIYGYGGATDGFAVGASTLLFVVPIAAVLLLPLLIFVTTASRMGAAQRERRLAALRLIGVDARRIRRIAAAESLLGAFAGLLVGAGLFLLLRPLLSATELFGIRLFGEDFVPSPSLLVLIVLLVPGLAVGAAMFGLRRTIVEPLGMVRHSKPVRRRMWWRWAVVGVGAVLMLSTLFAEVGSGSEGVAVVLTAGSVLVLIGIAVVLPWAVEKLAGALRGGPPSWQFAIRRLQLDSGTASRVVSGLVVVLAGTILIQVLVASVESRSGSSDRVTIPEAAPVEVSVESERMQEVRQRLAGVEGVDAVYPIRTASASRSGQSVTSFVQVEIGDCAALAVRARIGSCTDGDAFLVGNHSGSNRGKDGSEPGSVEFNTFDENGEHQSGEAWELPGSLRYVPAEQSVGFYTETLLVTPGVIGAVQLPNDYVSLFVSGSGTVDELADRVAAAGDTLSWSASISSNSMKQYIAQTDRQVEMFRNILLGASLFVLAVAALSLLMLSVEQITERRRPLAALSAAGVPISVLAKASLWQTAVPVLVGVGLAVGAGIGLTAPILRLADLPMALDAGMIATLAATAVGAVLVVSVLTLPLLRQVTRLDGLRAE
ncbi:FtsX-like permease family protein [Amycolatopsis marina]|uniref:FtsX-like permease family protein n=1 Tax=Amycolatopsis marina TaxID=490629 RepID=UPI00318404C1